MHFSIFVVHLNPDLAGFAFGHVEWFEHFGSKVPSLYTFIFDTDNVVIVTSWVASPGVASILPCVCRYYDFLIDARSESELMPGASFTAPIVGTWILVVIIKGKEVSSEQVRSVVVDESLSEASQVMLPRNEEVAVVYGLIKAIVSFEFVSP